jgi:ArsR family transcriptional regulator, nickel/cobalt-responsive transcriptional repressor
MSVPRGSPPDHSTQIMNICSCKHVALGTGYCQLMGHGVEGRTPQAKLDATTAESVADTLSALTAPSRLLILGRLREGPASVTELTQAIGLEQSAISHQLRVLRSLGLVNRQRSGRSTTYSLYDHHVASLLDEAVFHAEHLRMGTPDRATGQSA